MACCRRIRALFHDALSRRALDLIEQFSDGHVDKRALYDFLYSNMQEEIVSDRFSFAQVFGVAAWWNITFALIDVRLDVVRQLVTELTWFSLKGESMSQCYWLYDIFANPTRPTIMVPAWRSPKAITVAQTIYNNRAFDRMPELAHALQEAGCDNDTILTHCNRPGPHTKGCWVVDLVLGKE